MTVAVSCNLSDGVILGVDSAVTLPGPGGVLKIYENAEKLFQLGEMPIGIAFYGIAGFENRGIGSFIREFELKNPDNVISDTTKIEDIAEGLRIFFYEIYARSIIPIVEKETGEKFSEQDRVPLFGLVIGGYSHGEYLSQIWNIEIPQHDTPGSAQEVRSQGSFGTNWFATFEPIRRYIKGFDPRLLDEVLQYLDTLRGSKFTESEFQEIQNIASKFEYSIPFEAMPLEEGLNHTKFLIEMVINHHRYVIGAPVVGGKVRIGKVTYKGDKFQILE